MRRIEKTTWRRQSQIQLGGYRRKGKDKASRRWIRRTQDFNCQICRVRWVGKEMRRWTDEEIW